MHSLKKFSQRIPRTKQANFLGSNWGKTDSFWDNRSFFQKLGSATFFQAEWRNAKYAKFPENPYGGSCEELFTDPI